jgi:hypothetical protein
MLSSEAANETVNRMNDSVAELRKVSDLEGLLRLQAEALAISTKVNGRARRKARRIANKASGAVNEILDNGGETRLERADRDARGTREPAEPARTEGSTLDLLGRSVSLLHLLLFDGSEVTEEVGALQQLATRDEHGFLLIEIPADIRVNAAALVRGYEQSRQIYRAAAYRRSKVDPERILKMLAVDLVAQGAEVRNLKRDSVPLVAYGIFVGKISSDLKTSISIPDKMDDILLGISNEAARVPPSSRPLFIDMLRLAMLLGEAQAYAEHHGVAALLPGT